MISAKTICGTILREGRCVTEKNGNKISVFHFPSIDSAKAYFDKRRLRAIRGAKTRRDYHVSYNIPNMKLV